jgi:hypothetical protein
MRKLVILLGLLSTLQTVSAQEEKVTVETSEEAMDSSRFSRLLRSYNQLIRVREEERVLLKVDLLGPALYALSLGGKNDSTPRNVSNLVRISLEKKIRPDLAWIVSTTIRADPQRVQEVGVGGGLRYYYNLNRRILQGKSANNFSANYLTGQVTGRTRMHRDGQQVALQLLYGIQRRIFSWAYVDFNTGLSGRLLKFPEDNNRLDLIANIQLGIAF